MENGKVEMKYEDFMDLMDERTECNAISIELDEILDLLFESARLSYGSDELYFDVGASFSQYLKMKERARYIGKLQELNIKKEGE